MRNVALPAEVRAEPYDLTQYRLRHALHHYDPDIIAAHQAHPWALIWDDHEIDDNWVGDYGKDPGTDPAVFRKRKAAAFQAYYENLPLRLPNKPNGPSARLYRGLGYGRLAQFHLLDTRQYRDDQACGDKTSDCAERLTPGRTVLGDAQERWLFDGLRRSRATWNIIPQQIPVTQVDTVPGDGRAFVMDFWDGYKAGPRPAVRPARRPEGAQPGRADRRHAPAHGRRPADGLRRPAFAHHRRGVRRHLDLHQDGRDGPGPGRPGPARRQRAHQVHQLPARLRPVHAHQGHLPRRLPRPPVRDAAGRTGQHPGLVRDRERQPRPPGGVARLPVSDVQAHDVSVRIRPVPEFSGTGPVRYG